MNTTKITSKLISPATNDPFQGALRVYKNKNTGTWLFGFATDSKSPSGLRSLWTHDESLALADWGAVAAMLGLGTDQPMSFAMGTSAGVGGSGITRWDSVLEQQRGGSHAVACMCKRGQTVAGGGQPFIREDGKQMISRQ